MISIEEALKIICEETTVLEAVKTGLHYSLGKVLAEDIYAKDSLPPFDKSAMDGYAVRSSDGQRLKVARVVKAGDALYEGIKPGEALKIMTGAPIPAGADAVVKKEDTAEDGDFVSILKPAKEGQNILKAGEEIREGDLALPKGKTIRPAEIGLLASLGYSRVSTYRVPRIALLVTGDELVDVDDKLELGKIRNCNEYTISAMAAGMNAEVISYGIVRDNPEEIMHNMKDAFSKADIVVSTGGASVGDYDYIGMILDKVGADTKFSAVAVKPGKPVNFATYGGKLFFGLPGNPLSVISTFEEFISPAIKKMMGRQDLREKTFHVVLENDIKVSTGRTNHVYVFIEKKDGVYCASKAGQQSSNALLTISRANGIVVLDGSAPAAKAGEIADAKFIFR